MGETDIDLAVTYIGQRKIIGWVTYPESLSVDITIQLGRPFPETLSITLENTTIKDGVVRSRFVAPTAVSQLRCTVNEISVFAESGTGDRIKGRVSERLRRFFGQEIIGDFLVTLERLESRGVQSLFFDKTHYKSVLKRKEFACLTYANSPEVWFPYFLHYYRDILEISDIYVITPNPELFGDLDLSGVIGLKGIPYDDGARAVLVSNISSGLVAYFENVLVVDVDEIIYAGKDAEAFRAKMSQIHSEVIWAAGVEIIQHPGESDFDFQRSIFDQRKFGCINHSLSKPVVVRSSTRFSPGHHSCGTLPPLDPVSQGVFLLHLKYADNKMRLALSGIVSRTAYSSGAVESYSQDSLKAAYHPKAISTSKPGLSIREREVAEDYRGYFDHFEPDIVAGFAHRQPRNPLDCTIVLASLLD